MSNPKPFGGEPKGLRIARLVTERCGQMITIFALLSPALLGFMGLALDTGYIFHVKRRMQTAADAGALGGAKELWRGNYAMVTPAAKNDTGLNGFTDANAAIEVNYPPKNGPRAGNAGFVEVIISQEAPTFFLRVIDRDRALVRSRAVAGVIPGVGGCIMALDPDARGALTVQGTANLTAGCGVMVNSTHARAITVNGTACINAGQVGVAGDYVSNGSANCINPSPTTEVPPAMDPLAYLSPPEIPETAMATNLRISGGTVVLEPGRYDGGIDISGGNVTFNPGTYILNGGGMRISGTPTVTGLGVMFYNTWSEGAPGGWGEINIAGTAIVTFKAPSSGEYEGMLFWNDPKAPYRDPGSVINGTSESSFEGMLYFPSTNLAYSGTSDSANWTMMIAKTLTISGTTDVNSNYGDSDIVPPTRIATLVE